MLRDADEWKNDYTFFTAVQRVYAWTDQSCFNNGASVSFNGDYIEIYFDNGIIKNRIVDTNDYLLLFIWPRYAPLQY